VTRPTSPSLRPLRWARDGLVLNVRQVPQTAALRGRGREPPSAIRPWLPRAIAACVLGVGVYVCLAVATDVAAHADGTRAIPQATTAATTQSVSESGQASPDTTTEPYAAETSVSTEASGSSPASETPKASDSSQAPEGAGGEGSRASEGTNASEGTKASEVAKTSDGAKAT
jgi:hypothetical protein